MPDGVLNDSWGNFKTQHPCVSLNFYHYELINRFKKKKKLILLYFTLLMHKEGTLQRPRLHPDWVVVCYRMSSHPSTPKWTWLSGHTQAMPNSMLDSTSLSNGKQANCVSPCLTASLCPQEHVYHFGYFYSTYTEVFSTLKASAAKNHVYWDPDKSLTCDIIWRLYTW